LNELLFLFQLFIKQLVEVAQDASHNNYLKVSIQVF
ncbi:uncharacterized protein METZ01_LOCUS495249, partial [marine metagenome]